MMSNEYSRDALLQFLDYLGEKGLMNPATVSSRKAATNTFLGILSDDDSRDVRGIDLDDLLLRFGNLKGSSFKPESIRVYKSRVSSAIKDFIRYRDNPAAFRPTIQTKNPSPKKPRIDNPNRDITSLASESPFRGSPEIVFPIPIRAGITVQIAGIPSDLTEQEAKKIGAVVMALAQKV